MRKEIKSLVFVFVLILMLLGGKRYHTTQYLSLNTFINAYPIQIGTKNRHLLIKLPTIYGYFHVRISDTPHIHEHIPRHIICIISENKMRHVKIHNLQLNGDLAFIVCTSTVSPIENIYIKKILRFIVLHLLYIKTGKKSYTSIEHIMRLCISAQYVNII